MGPEADARARDDPSPRDLYDDDRSNSANNLQKKSANRTYAEHFLDMFAVCDARSVADSLVLHYIVHHASPEHMNVMRAKYDPTRVDNLRHAEELAHFAQSIELGSGAIGLEVVAAHV